MTKRKAKKRKLDPLEILAAIAADAKAPVTARVAACRALVLAAAGKAAKPAAAATETATSRRAIILLGA